VIPQYGLQRGYFDFASSPSEELARTAIAQNAAGQKLTALVVDRQPRFEMVCMRQHPGSSIQVVHAGRSFLDVHRTWTVNEGLATCLFSLTA
jgi:hypothetical protein